VTIIIIFKPTYQPYLETQAAVTYTSVGIVFVILCAIVLYHTVIKSLCQQNHYFQQMMDDLKLI